MSFGTVAVARSLAEGLRRPARSRLCPGDVPALCAGPAALHDRQVTSTVPVARGVGAASVVGALATAAGALPVLFGLTAAQVPTGAVYAMAWPLFGLVGTLLLDRGRTPRLGGALVGVALVPLLVAGIATARRLEGSFWSAYEQTWQDLLVTCLVLTVGALTWGHGAATDRLSRRRLLWLVVGGALLVAATSATAASGTSVATATVTSIGLALTAGLVLALVLAENLRPVDEPLADAGLVVATALAAVVLGLAVDMAADRVRAPNPDAAAAVVAVAAAGLVAPAALRLRRFLLEGRYGTGVLTPADVAAITADLHRDADPRLLAGKAAAMVAAASGHPQGRLVLGGDVPDPEPGWFVHPLAVGGDRVGSLLLRAPQPEGPEPRQEARVDQLLPTVALVARAVGLAVEAEHARQDVTRQREAERARILEDLHDGLGPVLAGMSMRVQAQLRTEPGPLLSALATELAECRGDLRRIVSGLTPSALAHDDLPRALERLVQSFGVAVPSIELTTDVDGQIAPAVAVAVYRCVAEGITNAVRHAGATQVHVAVATRGAQVVVEISDDGAGRAVVPGVGLTSLRRRAEALGGRLDVHVAATGTRLCVQLPTVGAVA